MTALEALRDSIPDAARDIRLNLAAVLSDSSLTPAQRYGVAVAAAATSRHEGLRAALADEARAQVGPAVVDDALAAASLMAMNNVFYRFRHLIGKPAYGEKPARLRMNRLAKPATSKADFELMSLAVSALNGCETCVKAHERVVLEAGLTEDQVNDAVRVAAVVHAAAVALDLATLVPALALTPAA